jgi:hypothetical protein
MLLKILQPSCSLRSDARGSGTRPARMAVTTENAGRDEPCCRPKEPE